MTPRRTISRLLLKVDQGIVSIGDQGFISAGNFVSGVIVARALGPEGFGLYVLANLSLMLALEMQNGLALQPMVLNGAALDESTFRQFFWAGLPLQVAFIALSSLAVAGVALAWEPLRVHALVLAAAAALCQGQELCRRGLYTRARTWSALANNVVNYDVQAVLLGLAAWQGRLDLSTVFSLVAFSSLLAVLLGLVQLRDLGMAERGDLWAVARQNFALGKWTACMSGLTCLSVQAYPVTLAAVSGLASTGGLGVIIQLLGPSRLLTRPLQNYYVPSAVRALSDTGVAGLNRVLAQAAWIVGPPYLCYMAILAAGAPFVLAGVFGEDYVRYADALRLYVLVALVSLPAYLLEVEVGARRMLRQQAIAMAGAVLIIYSLGLYLAARFGLIGAAVTAIVTTAGQLTFLVAVVVRTRRAEFGRGGMRTAAVT